jgi:hypothetical protein
MCFAAAVYRAVGIGSTYTYFTNHQTLNVRKSGLGNTEVEELARGNIVYVVTDLCVKMWRGTILLKIHGTGVEILLSLALARFLASQRLKTGWDEICCGECWKN